MVLPKVTSPGVPDGMVLAMVTAEAPPPLLAIGAVIDSGAELSMLITRFFSEPMTTLPPVPAAMVTPLVPWF